MCESLLRFCVFVLISWGQRKSDVRITVEVLCLGFGLLRVAWIRCVNHCWGFVCFDLLRTRRIRCVNHCWSFVCWFWSSEDGMNQMCESLLRFSEFVLISWRHGESDVWITVEVLCVGFCLLRTTPIRCVNHCWGFVCWFWSPEDRVNQMCESLLRFCVLVLITWGQSESDVWISVEVLCCCFLISSGQRNNTGCCRTNNVPDSCLGMCSGSPPPFNNSLAVCIPKLSIIEACVQQGLGRLTTCLSASVSFCPSVCDRYLWLCLRDVCCIFCCVTVSELDFDAEWQKRQLCCLNGYSTGCGFRRLQVCFLMWY